MVMGGLFFFLFDTLDLPSHCTYCVQYVLLTLKLFYNYRKRKEKKGPQLANRGEGC